MNLDRQLVRLMAAMIVMIIAYVAPSVVQAHEGHGHHQVTVKKAEVAPSAAQALSAPRTSVTTWAEATTALTVLPVASAGLAAKASIQSDEQGRGCCPGPCKSACCGTMSCCVPGILTDAASLPTLPFGPVTMISYDVTELPGVGPEALPRPPRTLA